VRDRRIALKHKEEIITIGERAINYCADQERCLWIKSMLIHQYVKWGMKEEAKKVLEMLPAEIWTTQDALAGEVLEGEEWRKNQEWRIARITALLCHFVGQYAEKAGLPSLEKIEMLKIGMELERLLDPLTHNLDEEHLSRAFCNMDIAEIYCEAGNSASALDCMEQSVQDAMYHIDVMDQTNDEGGNYYPWPTPRNLCWILWEDHLTKSQFDLIRNSEQFIAYDQQLRENSRELK
jgi:hypothetical protein